jgi:hypothetical protein
VTYEKPVSPTEKSNMDKFMEIQARAVSEAKKAANQVFAEIKSANEKIKTELDKRSKLSAEEKKTLLSVDEENLQRRVMNELVETRTSLILIDKAIATKQAKMIQLNLLVTAPNSIDAIVQKARIDSESADLEKLLVQKTYLNTVYVELAKASRQISNIRSTERFKPIESHLRGLLNEVDKLQSESDALSKASTDPSVVSARATLEEGKKLIEDSNAF